MNAYGLTWASCALLLAACAGTSNAPLEFRGSSLVSKTGMTLYTYDKDAGGKSACIDACAKLWPPYMAAAEDKPTGDFSVITRPDGSRQWAYRDKPLYLWVKDTKPGDQTGDNFANVWHKAVQGEIKDLY